MNETVEQLHDALLCFLTINRSMVNKPKEFAHLLRDKFGSADQINMLGMCNALLTLIRVCSSMFC